MISDLSSFDYSYDSYTEDQLDEIPQYKCRRNSITNQVFMRKYKQRRYILRTGLANRPLWICDQ